MRHLSGFVRLAGLLRVSVPLPGFSGLRPPSPLKAACPWSKEVSVPLPGFSGLRHLTGYESSNELACFSPVAGIQWVETLPRLAAKLVVKRFSPVAGIQWVETFVLVLTISVWQNVSVPLPGFSGLRPSASQVFAVISSWRFSPVAGIQWVETSGIFQNTDRILFQSRCRDSVG